MKKFGFRSLNLPDTIQFRYGNQIINRYAADGRKLGTEYFTRVTNLAVPLITGQVINQTYTINTINQNGTAYIDNKEYNTLKGNPALTTLQRVYNAEGYAQNITATTPNYYYYRQDHLGNNREVWLANTKKTVQRTQYYPSGLPWASIASDSTGLQERKYNGKEFVEMHGYDTYEYGARGYYAAMGKFMTVDPLAEKRYSVSPYVYCLNNPIRYIDHDGNFELDANQVRQYPILAQLLKNGIQDFKNSPDVMHALMKYGQLSKKQILNDLEWGNGPKVKVLSIERKAVAGRFLQNRGSNILELNKEIAAQLEKATGKEKEVLLFYIADIILHEYTHYGDDQDGVQYSGVEGNAEAGNAFEIAAFGAVIDRQCAFFFEEEWKIEREADRQKEEDKRKESGFYYLQKSNFNNMTPGTYSWDGYNWVQN